MSKVKVLNHDEDKLCNKCGKTVFVGLKRHDESIFWNDRCYSFFWLW